MTNWLEGLPTKPGQAEEPGARFAPRRVDPNVRSRRVTAPNTRLYHKRRLIRAQRGIDVTSVPVEMVRPHVEKLLGYGMSHSMIAAAAGCGYEAVRRVAAGERTYLQRRTADGILSVSHTPHPLQRYVLAIGAVRRIQALQAIGWAIPEIAHAIGERESVIQKVGDYPKTTYARWRQVADLFEKLSATPGTNLRTRNWAKKHGWAPPLAWEGVDIDHPDHGPVIEEVPTATAIDEVLFQRILRGEHHGEVKDPERTALLDYAVDHGWSGPKVAQHLNMKLESGDRAIVRHRKKRREAAA
ncbi:hypothetical protein ACFRAQ_36295 [Nocardia sp. NPDC056611]|uniref:hypothetical protein n=1 Tax=Nocardia sp. NPDC056611 TaxID=3345877 RepID=UPI00366CE0F0